MDEYDILERFFSLPAACEIVLPQKMCRCRQSDEMDAKRAHVSNGIIKSQVRLPWCDRNGAYQNPLGRSNRFTSVWREE